MTRGAEPPTVAVMSPQALSDLDLVALSDRAWDIVDPAGAHEAEEQTWTVRLRRDWPPLQTADDLRGHLDQLAATVQPSPPAVPLRAVAAVMVFLAEHEERRDTGDAVLGEALRAAFGDGTPADVAAWMAQRRRSPEAQRRGDGAAHPRRTDVRPRPAEG
jgi:hypothetical protein